MTPRLTPEQFEEIKRLHIASGMFFDRGKELTEEEKVLDRKWAPFDICGVLIDEIDALREENKVLREALERIGTINMALVSKEDIYSDLKLSVEIARKALGRGGKE